MFVDNGQMTNYSGYSQGANSTILAHFSCSWDGSNIQFDMSCDADSYRDNRTQIDSDFEDFKAFILEKISLGELQVNGEPK